MINVHFSPHQGCAESWNHVPGAPEADLGRHPNPASPGHPNARPRRSGLSYREGQGRRDGCHAAAAATAEPHVRADG